MYMSRGCMYGLFVVAWLCCSSLHIGARNPNPRNLITNPEEVKALRAIKSSLIDPYKNLSSWDRGDPCKENWTGVMCHNTTLDDEYRHVQQLLLLRMNLSGILSPELGRLSNLTILCFMWNNISGSIPREIGSITPLKLLLLNGNKLTGPLPEELGYLPNLNILQIDENQISGPLPTSFANLTSLKHFHMNNNSISGQIPPDLSKLTNLLHFLFENNNLSGNLPPEFSELSNLRVLQLDNNNFNGTTIPASYSKMSKLVKLSLRNCSLQGPIPDLSQIPYLLYLDLSSNQLNGSIPTDELSKNITTIYLSDNNLTGTIPTYFSGLPHLQKLSIANNSLNGSVPSTIWQHRTLRGMESFTVELQNNEFSNITGSIVLPPNVTAWLQGNPLCSNANLVLQFCQCENNSQSSTNTTSVSFTTICPPPYECSSTSAQQCVCAAPLFFGYRLKSPGFADFRPYIQLFEGYLTHGLYLSLNQLDLNSFAWEEGPRLRMYLKLFPVNNTFNSSEVLRITGMFTGRQINRSDIFGPYELLNYRNFHLFKVWFKQSFIGWHSTGDHCRCSYIVCCCYSSDTETAHEEAPCSFKTTSSFAQVGQGGYGKVYKGILADGTVVAIKRAQEGSLQGEREFLTEIELLSRVHHRNLVSLSGYCDEEGEQMLVYEFMRNGTLRDHLSGTPYTSFKFAFQ